MKKKILIILGTLFTVAIIGVGVFKYYVKPKYVAPLIGAIEEFLLEDEETVELLIKEYQNSLEENSADNNADNNEDNNESATNNQEQGSNSKDTNDNKEPSTEQKTKDNSVVGGKSIQEIQKQVEPGDLKAGLSIASKLDTGHLLGLAKGGLTPEDKKEAKEYLQSTLTSGEYSQLKYFVGKYAHLLK